MYGWLSRNAATVAYKRPLSPQEPQRVRRRSRGHTLPQFFSIPLETSSPLMREFISCATAPLLRMGPSIAADFYRWAPEEWLQLCADAAPRACAPLCWQRLAAPRWQRPAAPSWLRHAAPSWLRLAAPSWLRLAAANWLRLAALS